MPKVKKTLKDIIIADPVYNPECSRCQCSKKTLNICTEGVGDYKPLMLVDTSPSIPEDDVGDIYTNPGAMFLRDELLPRAGLSEDDIRFTYAVKCVNSKPSIPAILQCYSYLEAEVKKHKPKVIGVMGNVALASVLWFAYKKADKKDAKVSGIMKWRGKAIWHREFNCWVIPMTSPTFLWNKDLNGLTYDTEKAISDLELMNEYCNNDYPVAPYPKNTVISTPKQALAVIRKCEEAGVFSYDIETGGKGEERKYIIGCSFAVSETQGWYMHIDTLMEDPVVFHQYIKLLRNPKHLKIMHNMAFEARVHSGESWSIYTRNCWDTMIGAQMLDENFPCNLKDLSWVFTSYGGYDFELDLYKKAHKIKEDYSEIPFELISKYGGLDATSTFTLYVQQKKKLRTAGLLPLFSKITMPARAVASRAEVNGFRVDREWVEYLIDTGDAVKHKLEESIYGCAGRKFNINSGTQLQAVLFKDLKLKPLRKTKTGYSVDAKSIDYCAEQKNGEVAQYLSDYSYLKTMIGTHAKQAITFSGLDGRVHTNFNFTGTVTGRLSCLAKGTLIVTNKGCIPIEDVKAGMLTISHKGVVRRIDQLIDQGVRPVYKLTIGRDRDIFCTTDHKFYTPDGWVEAKDVRELYYVNIKDAYERCRISGKCSENVCWDGLKTNCNSNCKGIGHNSAECERGFTESINEGSVSSRKSNKVFSIQDCWEKLYDRAKRRRPSQLEGSTSRWLWLFSFKCRWQTLFLSQDNNGTNVRHTPGRFRQFISGASYRWQSFKQSKGQFGTMHKSRAYQVTPQVERVKAFTFVGEIQVFDLTVDVDESFVANGFLVHNCSKPSLQNVPNDGFLRSMYIASEGRQLLEADLKSAELVYLAVVSGEEFFLRAFREGRDLHADTYNLVMGLPEDNKPTKAERLIAKRVNFGLVYGISAVGLSKILGLPVEEIEDFMYRYFKMLPAVASYLDWSDKFVIEHGYVMSLFNRKRHLPDAQRDDEYAVARACRQGKNAPIQSGASDYTQNGIVRVDRAMRKMKADSDIVHTVHDCVIIDAVEPEIDDLKDMVTIAFETPLKILPVRMRVEIETMTRWGSGNDSRVKKIFESVGYKVGGR